VGLGAVGNFEAARAPRFDWVQLSDWLGTIRAFYSYTGVYTLGGAAGGPHLRGRKPPWVPHFSRSLRKVWSGMPLSQNASSPAECFRRRSPY
jgi:hypothetical protein